MNHNNQYGEGAARPGRAMQIVPALNRSHPVHCSADAKTNSSSRTLSTNPKSGPTLTFQGRESRYNPAPEQRTRHTRWQPLNTGLRPGMLLDVHV